MPLGVANPTKGAVASGGAATTGAVNTAASGSTYVVGSMSGSGATFTSITDNKSNVFSPVAAQVSGGLRANFYYKENGAGGSGHTFTGTWSVGAATTLALEITGGKLLGILDPTPPTGNDDVASPFTSNNITTNQDKVLLVAFLAGDSGSNPATHAESTGFTVQSSAEETNGASFWTGCLATKIVSATGTYGASFTETGATEGIVFIAAFEEAEGGGGITLMGQACL